jgi:hypothetical protein
MGGCWRVLNSSMNTLSLSLRRRNREEGVKPLKAFAATYNESLG